jgi:hypothetical protein
MRVVVAASLIFDGLIVVSALVVVTRMWRGK